VDAYVRLAASAAATPPLAFTRHYSAVSANDMCSGTIAENVVDWDWQTVAKNVFQDDKRPIILFDGHCNLCNGGVNFAIDHDPQGAFSTMVVVLLNITYLFSRLSLYILF
jgi:hypothetical protein